MRVAHDLLGGISGVVDEDFLRGDQDIDGVAISFDVEGSVRRELQQVQAREVAGGIVEEHVFAARVAGVDAGGVFRSVPAIDRGVVLHAGIAAVPGSLGNFLHQIFGFESLHHATAEYGLGGEVGVANDRVHKIVGDANGVICVLKEDRRVGVGIGMRAVVSHRNQCVGLGFFFLLALDKVDDVR